MFTKDSNLKSSMDRKLASINEKKKKEERSSTLTDRWLLFKNDCLSMIRKNILMIQ